MGVHRTVVTSGIALFIVVLIVVFIVATSRTPTVTVQFSRGE
jgi:hypothetical protein